jgi:RND superfamily putative drug exporter
MRRAWATLLLALVIGGAVFAFAGSTTTDNDPTSSLPASAESTKVAQLQKELPSGRTNPALIVIAKDGAELSESDLGAFADFGQAIPSEDRKAAIITVPLAATGDADETSTKVQDLRDRLKAAAPDGVTAQVTGGAGFGADLSNSFSGANTRLLLVTVIVVTILLLVTYRSPILWIVPLFVVGFADQLAAKAIALFSQHTDLAINGSTTGIVTVLVFGAGTNYALLLISRYREELHKHEDRFEAMRVALRGAGPAILASSGTVFLALLTLLLASLKSNAALGVTAAVGIAIAALFALVVLPAALVVCGRKLFWPFIPRVGQDGAESERGFWGKVGRMVVKRPVAVTAFSIVVLGVLSLGAIGTKVGLSQTEQFRVEAESVQGLETLSKYFPAGAAGPATILTSPDKADAALKAVTETPGVVQARVAEQNDSLVSISAVLQAAPDTAEAFQTIRDLRENLGDEAMVGGTVATALDTRDAARHDLVTIVPVILILVFLVLVLLLRALVAPVLLMATVVLSFLASLGAGSWLFRNVFDYPALDNSVPLFAFLFLVALGVDYNIFLVTRAKEETPARGTRDGMVHALAVTGAVITSAGILLAAVFAVLGVLPVVTLTQIGVIVGIGVLLDTLLVRTVLVPALATLTGDKFWWPGKLHTSAPAADQDGSRERTDWDSVNRSKLSSPADK